MHTPALLSLLLAVSTATLVRAQGCPDPTAEGWIAQYAPVDGSGTAELVCYWRQCAELAGHAGLSPILVECLPHDRCLNDRAKWCVDKSGERYQGRERNIFDKRERGWR